MTLRRSYAAVKQPVPRIHTKSTLMGLGTALVKVAPKYTISAVTLVNA